MILDFRTSATKQFIGVHPAIIPQSELDEAVDILSGEGQPQRTVVEPP